MHRQLPIYRSGTFYTMCSGGLGHGLRAAVGVAPSLMGLPAAWPLAAFRAGPPEEVN
jgi:hypothetical protein